MTAEGSSPKKSRRKRRRWRHRIAIALGVFVVLSVGLLLAGWAWIESDSAALRMRGWIETRASAALDRAVSMDGLEIDLVPFRLRADGVRVAGDDSEDTPFFEVETVRLSMRFGALLERELIVSSLELTGPTLHLDLRPDGSSNAPALPTAGAVGAGFQLRVDSVRFNDGRVEVNHRPTEIDASLSELDFEIRRPGLTGGFADRHRGAIRVAVGRLTVGSGRAAEFSSEETAEAPETVQQPAAAPVILEPVTLEVRFELEPEQLAIDELTLQIAQSLLEARGTVRRWGSVDLEIEAQVDSSNIGPLWQPLRSLGSDGIFDVVGTLRLTETDGPSFTGELNSEALTFGGLLLSNIATDLEIAGSVAAARNLTLEGFGGSIEATAGLDFGAQPHAWDIDYSVADIDLARLTRSPSLRGVRFAGRAGASGNVTWQGAWRETISGSGSMELEVPPAALVAAAASALPAIAPELQEAGPVGQRPEIPGTAPDPGAGPDPTAQAGPAVLLPSLPLPLTARADYQMSSGVLTLETARAALPNTEATASGQIDLDGDVRISVAVSSDDLRMVDRFFTQVRRYRGERPAPRPLGLRGGGRVGGDISGPLEQLAFDGTLSAERLIVADAPIGVMEGGVRLSGSRLEIDELMVYRGDGSGNGQARVRIGRARPGDVEPDYSFTLGLERYPIEAKLAPWDFPISVVGPTSGSAQLAGDYGDWPIGEFEVAAEGVELNGVGPFTADARVLLDEQVWLADRFRLEGPAGELAVSGGWRRGEETVSASLNATRIDATALATLLGREWPVAGQLAVVAEFGGRLADPDGTATLWWTAARAYGIALGSLATSATTRDGIAAFTAVGSAGARVLTAPRAVAVMPRIGDPPPLPEVPPQGWAASLSLAIDEPRLAAARAEGDAGWMQALLASQGIDLPADLVVEGQLSARGSGPLDDWHYWRGEASLSDLQLDLAGATVTATQPLRLDLAAGRLDADLPGLASEDGSMSAHAVIDLASGRWLEAEADGHLDLEALRLFRPELVASGHAEGTLRATGTVTATEIRGQIALDEVTLGTPRWPYVAENVGGSIQLQGDRLQLVGVRGSTEGRPFSLGGTLPLAALSGERGGDPVTLELTVDELPLAPLLEKSETINALVTTGVASLTASMRGRGMNWRDYGGEVALDGIQLDLGRRYGVEVAEPTVVELREAVLHLPSPVHLEGPGTNLSVSGSMNLDPVSLDLRVGGRTSLDPLNNASEAWGVAGSADVDLHITGIPPDLSYTGSVQLIDGLLSPPPLGQPIDHVEALLTLEGRQMRIDEFTGVLGGSTIVRGTTVKNVCGSGEVQLRDSKPHGFSMALNVGTFCSALEQPREQAPAALVRLTPNVRVTVSAQLQHEGTAERSLLSGTILLEDSDYRQAWRPGDPLLPVDTATTSNNEDVLRSVNLDLRIEAPRNLRVDNNIAKLELRADLELRGTLFEPVLLGRATALDGDVFWRDNTYRILQGAVEFANPIRTEPNFEVRAETILRQYTITLSFSGSFERGVQFNYTASPPLSDLELFQLLALGEEPDIANRDEPSLGNVGLQASSFLTAQYMSEVERGAQRVFGLDRFRIEPTVFAGTTDPTARVTLGEQVTPNLFVTYSTVLGSTEEQLFTVEYQATRGLRILVTREEDGSFGMDFHFVRRY